MNSLNMVRNEVSISESSSMFSLTDWHKVFGGVDNKRPSRFMRGWKGQKL